MSAGMLISDEAQGDGRCGEKESHPSVGSRTPTDSKIRRCSSHLHPLVRSVYHCPTLPLKPIRKVRHLSNDSFKTKVFH